MVIENFHYDELRPKCIGAESVSDISVKILTPDSGPINRNTIKIIVTIGSDEFYMQFLEKNLEDISDYIPEINSEDLESKTEKLKVNK